MTIRDMWITNSPTAARLLRKADKRFEADMNAARHLPLAEKIVAIREAKARRQCGYDEAARAER